MTVSPNGGPVCERKALHRRFAKRLSTNDSFSRKVVSYQGNRAAPGLRWMKYKEGFAENLVHDLINDIEPDSVLDPFAGICTTPLVAGGLGKAATGIEIMPIGVLAGKAISEAANGLDVDAFERCGTGLLQRMRRKQDAPTRFAFPHVRITESAFSPDTEAEIARARSFISRVDDEGHGALLNLACLSALEEASYTRKDGQYLRWDGRSGRPLRSSVDKGPIARFSDAVQQRLSEIIADTAALKKSYGGKHPDLVIGSCLELLKDLPSESFDMVITSPPYANRYDYTRTYALELAWLGFDQDGFSALRQRMLSATVENNEKTEWLGEVYGDERETLDAASLMYAEQGALHEVLHILMDHVAELSNRNIIRLIELYFFELAVVIAELGRIVRPGGTVIMVNDNVRYHGEELPVDFILSDFAEWAGFRCENIWKLPRGKGNSSQQMARFGRHEQRKCVYKWVRNNG